MMEVNLFVYQSFCAILFVIGILGILLRKNILIMLMSIEIMLNAVNLSFGGFSHFHGGFDGQLAALFVITVAAAESAVGLSLVIALFRTLRSVNTEQIQLLRE